MSLVRSRRLRYRWKALGLGRVPGRERSPLGDGQRLWKVPERPAEKARNGQAREASTSQKLGRNAVFFSDEGLRCPSSDFDG
jgi:hypothetical protein